MSDFLLPGEVVRKILAKLPVKSVLVCKAVCRSWKNFTEDRSFPRFHFESQEHPTQSLLLSISPHLESLELGRIPFGVRDSAVQLTDPFALTNVNCDVILLGSCNGLIAACYNSPEATRNSFHSFFIWNPSMGLNHVLDLPEFPLPHYFVLLHGFGHVSATDDYKIVLTANYYVPGDLDSMGVHQGMVYSVRKRQWTVVESDTHDVVECQGVSVGEKLHWVLYPDYHVHHDEYLLAFDLETEQFQTMRLPDIPSQAHQGWDENFGIALVSFEGLLGLWHYGRRAQSGSVALWLMETYGDNQTWSLRHTFTIAPKAHISFLKPLVVSGNNRIYVRCSEQHELELVKFESGEEEERVWYINGWMRNRNPAAHEWAMIVYQPSLLWCEILGAAGNQGPGNGQEGPPPPPPQSDSGHEEEPLLCALQE
ncbi:hypothetical protein OROMI_005532 [Orobanche minor]